MLRENGWRIESRGERKRACDQRFRTESSNEEDSDWGSVHLIPKTCFEAMQALGAHPPTSGWNHIIPCGFLDSFISPPPKTKSSLHAPVHCAQHTLAQVRATPWVFQLAESSEAVLLPSAFPPDHKEEHRV